MRNLSEVGREGSDEMNDVIVKFKVGNLRVNPSNQFDISTLNPGSTV